MPANSKDSLTQRLARDPLAKLATRIGQQPVVGRMRHFFDGLRSDVKAAAHKRLPEVGALAERLAKRIFSEAQAGVRPVVNATGVLCPRDLETPLADAALEEVASVARDYAATTSAAAEVNTSVQRLLMELTGAQAALVLATHGGAVLATLSALAAGKQVVVARSHVGEIGGKYRLTDAAAQAGAQLSEVGCANHVSLDDYRQAIGSQTALIMRSVTCEFALVGCTGEVSLDDLAPLAASKQLPIVENLEAASLLDFAPLGTSQATIVGQSILAGADLVLFSGAGCIGGPACGIIVGNRSLIQRIAQHPLAAALRPGKLATSALEATLRLYRDPATVSQAIPIYQLLSASMENLRHRAHRLAPQLERCAAVKRVEVVTGGAYLNAGRLPGERIPTWCLAIEPAERDAEQLADALRSGNPSIWATVENDRLWLNLRGVLARQDEQIVAAFRALGVKPAEEAAVTPLAGPS